LVAAGDRSALTTRDAVVGTPVALAVIVTPLRLRSRWQTSDRADLLLHYHARVENQLDVQAANPPYDYGDDCDSSVYDAGTIMLDLVDAPTNTLVWRGWAKGSIQGAIDDQKLMEEKVDGAVANILARLPRRS